MSLRFIDVSNCAKITKVITKRKIYFVMCLKKIWHKVLRIRSLMETLSMTLTRSNLFFTSLTFCGRSMSNSICVRSRDMVRTNGDFTCYNLFELEREKV